MKRKKILVISGGIWPPAVYMAGTAAIYNLSKLLAGNGSFEIHVLTSIASWADPGVYEWARRQKAKHNLDFHFIKTDNLLLTRALFFIEAIWLNTKYRFDIIHDYSSSPLLVGLTGILGKLCRCKTLHTLCTVNESFWGSPKLSFGLVNKVVPLPIGVDTERFKPCPKAFKKTLLFLGQLDKRKGSSVLMMAAGKVLERYPDARFVFASYGKEGRDPNYQVNKKELQEIASGLGEGVVFLEGVQDVPRLMSETDVFILPTVSLHGTLAIPLTLLEAMSAGKPCVVSDLCCGNGLVEDKVNCLLFRSGDANDLADKVDLLLGDRELRERLGRAARQTVVDCFDINKVAEELSHLYLKL